MAVAAAAKPASVPVSLPGLARRVAVVQRWLTRIYRLEVAEQAHRYVLPPERARQLLPPRSPRTGVLVLEEDDTLWLGVYVDPRDRRNRHALVEETSHWLCLAWHAAHGRRVSRLQLELQGEVDQYAVNRLRGRDPFQHFRDFRWASWLGPDERDRYEAAHRAGHRYCRALSRRYPRRSDTPALLRELRDFYRAPGETKLRRAAA